MAPKCIWSTHLLSWRKLQKNCTTAYHFLRYRATRPLGMDLIHFLTKLIQGWYSVAFNDFSKKDRGIQARYVTRSRDWERFWPKLMEPFPWRAQNTIVSHTAPTTPIWALPTHTPLYTRGSGLGAKGRGIRSARVVSVCQDAWTAPEELSTILFDANFGAVDAKWSFLRLTGLFCLMNKCIRLWTIW